ncbi:sensor histidine kinase [Oerskovia flava]|uniref:sensor histidine kinase n=1 Tax=Oerskovia flava TaxID=2986422 RepID=UPI0022400195|nr:ATP-binding protein [Oerskovia sp. JB1-3-2]
MDTGPRSARRAVRRYVVATAGVLVLAVLGATAGAWWFATHEARLQAQDVARSFARTVMAPLNVDEVGGSGTQARDRLAEAVSALRADGDVYRVKVWRFEDDETVELVYSDATEIEGLRVPVSPTLREAISTGEPVVTGVPDDAAHATETGAPVDLVEVYLPFEDVDGQTAVVELYLVTQTAERARELLAHVLPLALLPPVLLAAATLPLALRLARGYAQAESERRELLARALAASEDERRRLARRLHDGLVQDLAALGVALEVGAGTEGVATGGATGGRDGTGMRRGPDALRAELAERVRDEIADLREVLDDLNPPEVEQQDLRTALDALVARLGAPADGQGSGPAVRVTGAAVDVDPARRALLLRCCAELVRNAVAHSGGTRVEIELVGAGPGSGWGREVGIEVRDDGHGFDVSGTPAGHHGLRLVRAAVEDAGGSVDVTSGPAGTHVRVVVPQAQGPG